MKILFICAGKKVDYQCDVVFHGLKAIYGKDVYETADYRFMFSDISDEQKSKLYGKGFSVTGLVNLNLKNLPTRRFIIKNIKNHFFDLIVYGSIRRCRKYFSLVMRHYPKEKIVTIDGEDECYAPIGFFVNKTVYFRRELSKDMKAAGMHPVSFGIPKEKIIDTVKEKTRMLAHIIPGDQSTYIYDDEQDYYNGYAEAYFGKTMRKAGWDCLRHYEIMANGCIPYFPDLAKCPEETMVYFPKKMILETNILFESKSKDVKILLEYSRKLLDYTRQNLTTEAVAKYIIDTALSQEETSSRSGWIRPYMEWLRYEIGILLFKAKREILYPIKKWSRKRRERNRLALL